MVELYSYKTIPLYNWNMIWRTRNYNYLRMDDNLDIEDNHYEHWVDVNNEHIDKHGLPDTYKKYLRLRKKQLKHLIKAIEGDRIHETHSDICERDIKEMLESQKVNKQTVDEVLVHIGKFYGKLLTDKDITASQYYDTLKVLNNG